MTISLIATYIATVLLVPQTGKIQTNRMPSSMEKKQINIPTKVTKKEPEEKIILRKVKKQKFVKNKKGKKGAAEKITEYDNENLNDIYKKERVYFRTHGSTSKKRRKSSRVSGPLAAIPLAVLESMMTNIANTETPKVEPPPAAPAKTVKKTPEQVLNVETAIQDSKYQKKIGKENQAKAIKFKPHKIYKNAKTTNPDEIKKELQEEVRSAEIREIVSESHDGNRRPSEAEIDTKDLLKKIEKKYTSHFIKIDLTSETTQALLEKTKTYLGNLYLAPGGLFKMDMKVPNKHMLLMDGKNIWVVDYPLDETQDKVQILHSKSAKNLKNQGFLDIFMGVGHLQKKFKIENSGKKDDEITYKLIPKEKNGQVERVELKVDDQAELINSVAFWDSLGNKTQLKFSEQEFKDKTPKEIFKFKPPKNSSITDL